MNYVKLCLLISFTTFSLSPSPIGIEAEGYKKYIVFLFNLLKSAEHALCLDQLFYLLKGQMVPWYPCYHFRYQYHFLLNQTSTLCRPKEPTMGVGQTYESKDPQQSEWTILTSNSSPCVPPLH